VARNEADKFVIEYYSSDKCLDKEKKGWINCSGYRAAKDNSKKPNGITLTPWDDERRAWHMACETPAEQVFRERVMRLREYLDLGIFRSVVGEKKGRNS